jgi:hypothetical protein
MSLNFVRNVANGSREADAISVQRHGLTMVGVHSHSGVNDGGLFNTLVRACVSGGLTWFCWKCTCALCHNSFTCAQQPFNDDESNSGLCYRVSRSHLHDVKHVSVYMHVCMRPPCPHHGQQ